MEQEKMIIKNNYHLATKNTKQEIKKKYLEDSLFHNEVFKSSLYMICIVASEALWCLGLSNFQGKASLQHMGHDRETYFPSLSSPAK